MVSGQWPNEILDPEIRELGFVVDRDAIRARLEQEIGFADFGKYAREQFIEGLPLVGCSTGRSAGFAPLRILSMYVATRRFTSSIFVL
jgi:hypothetical protein